MTPRPETFEVLIANIDEAARQYLLKGDTFVIEEELAEKEN